MNTKTAPSLLIIIPAFKENLRLPRFLAELAAAIDDHAPHAKILVVDDGSGANEQALLKKSVEGIRANSAAILPPLILPNNLGKGGAILTAWRQSSGYSHLAFVDADGAVSPEEVCRLIKILEQLPDATALFASRVKMLGKTVERKWIRHFTGRIFASLVGQLINPGIYDSQCGLKFVPATAFKKIEQRLNGHRFAFDVELLAALTQIGCPIVEVPIDWRDIPGSKVSLFRDTFRMFLSLLEIRREQKLK